MLIAHVRVHSRPLCGSIKLSFSKLERYEPRVGRAGVQCSEFQVVDQPRAAQARRAQNHELARLRSLCRRQQVSALAHG